MKFRTAISIAVLLSIPVDCYSDSPASTEPAPRQTFLTDGVDLFTAPLRMDKDDAKLTLLAGGLIGGMTFFDKKIKENLFPSRNNDPAVDMRYLGDYGQVAGPVVGTVFALHGWLEDDPKSKETAYLSYETFIWSGAVGEVFKYAVGRERPSTSDDPFVFHPAKGDSSFPSGHTTEAFAAATVFSEQYPYWAVIIPSYAAASTVGVSRLRANKHWASDVMAGAILGTTVSHLLRKWHRQSKKQTDQTFELSPTGIAWIKKF